MHCVLITLCNPLRLYEIIYIYILSHTENGKFHDVCYYVFEY